MSLYLKLTLLTVLALGAVCSYTDIAQGKIYNRHIKWGFICGFLILFFSLGHAFGTAYLKDVLINGTAGFSLGFFLWLKKQWSAGDAKLFSFFSFFLPLRYYSDSYVPFFPSINILLNTFFIILLCLFAGVLIFAAEKVVKGKISFQFKGFRREELLKFLKIIFSYILIVYLLLRLSAVKAFSPFFSNTILVFFLIYFLYGPLSENKKMADIMSFLSLGLVIVLSAVDPVLLLSIIRRALVFVILIGAVRKTFDLYITHRETVEVKVKDLKKGHLLIEKELKKIKDGLKRKGKGVDFDEIKNYGLNRRQIEMISDLYHEETTLIAYKAFHLAPLLFAGVLSAILTRSSLIYLAMQKLPRL